MQRFGTASIPTHSIGLALLKEDWHRAVSLILRTRPGEHPDVVAARQAWLVDGDLDRALELMPRRVVAAVATVAMNAERGLISHESPKSPAIHLYRGRPDACQSAVVSPAWRRVAGRDDHLREDPRFS